MWTRKQYTNVNKRAVWTHKKKRTIDEVVHIVCLVSVLVGMAFGVFIGVMLPW